MQKAVKCNYLQGKNRRTRAVRYLFVLVVSVILFNYSRHVHQHVYMPTAHLYMNNIEIYL